MSVIGIFHQLPRGLSVRSASPLLVEWVNKVIDRPNYGKNNRKTRVDSIVQLEIAIVQQLQP